MLKTDKVIYHTRTQEEYDWLMEKLDHLNCEWRNDNSLIKTNVWPEYKSETAISLRDKKAGYADYNFFLLESVDYDDFDFIRVSKLIIEEKES